jgi:hypothetical protein
LPLPLPTLKTAVLTSRRPFLSVLYTALMNFFCHGRSLKLVPASGPALHGKLSTNRMTRSARLRPRASHGYRADDARCADEAGFIAFAPSPRKPMVSLTFQLCIFSSCAPLASFPVTVLVRGIRLWEKRSNKQCETIIYSMDG